MFADIKIDPSFVKLNGPPDFKAFYAPKGEAIAGNFYEADLYYKGRKYNSSEHAFQRQKFSPYNVKKFDVEYDENYSNGMNSGEAAWRAAQKFNHLVRKDWLKIRDSIMEDVVNVKFDDPILFAKLKETEGDFLVEHAPGDHWGDNRDGSGRNILGKLLMQKRGDIVSETKLYRKWINSKTKLCRNCSQKGVHTDKNGKVHDFCGKSCADMYNKNSKLNPKSKPMKFCCNCYKQPVHVDTNGKVHDFCGKICASAYNKISKLGPIKLCRNCHKQPVNIGVNGKAHEFCGRFCASAYNKKSNSRPIKLCRNCHRQPVHVDTNGRVHDFCGKKCANV